MYGSHDEKGKLSSDNKGKNPLDNPDNPYIKHWIYDEGGYLFKPLNPQELTIISKSLENKKFDEHDKYDYDNIRNRIKYTCQETGFKGKDFNILEKILDKLYDYYTEYKKSLSEQINKQRNSTNEYREDFILASIYSSRYTEEHLIEILQMRHILDSCKKSNELYRLLCCNGQFEVESKILENLKEGYKNETIKIDVEYLLYKKLRVEKLILDYFGHYEDQIKSLEKLEKEYYDNLVKNDELFRKMQNKSRTDLKTLEAEVEKLKWDRYLLKTLIWGAKSSLKRLKDKIYSLVKKFNIILSGDLLSKLGKYSDFSDLLTENDRIISDAEEAEVVEVDI